MQQALLHEVVAPSGVPKDDDENVIVPTSSEQIGARLGKPDEGSALVQHQPAALDRQFQASTVFGRRGALPKQEGRIDLLDVDAAVLHRLDAAGDPKDRHNLPAELTEQSPRLIDD